MQSDFPAAHSMDTDWFAVDKCGHVALFRSGESGAVPLEAAIFLGPDGGDDALGKAIFGKTIAEQEEMDEWPDTGSAGLFNYEHETDNWISGPYQRQGAPDKPVRLEDLPPEVKQKLKDLRFVTLCFQETPKIQPVEHLTCESWEGAWLSLDGKNARPVPGREKEYREIYDNISAETAASDGITWEAPKAPSSSKQSPPAAAAPASGGFLAWLKRLFGGS
jgi:hypothetical protein